MPRDMKKQRDERNTEGHKRREQMIAWNKSEKCKEAYSRWKEKALKNPEKKEHIRALSRKGKKIYETRKTRMAASSSVAFNSRQQWTIKDEELLARMISDGWKQWEIGLNLGRSIRSIQHKARSLRLGA